MQLRVVYVATAVHEGEEGGGGPSVERFSIFLFTLVKNFL